MNSEFEMLATCREKRSNAGNRLSQLLEEEEEEDFYKSAYGGFEEEENDSEFKSEDEAEESDSVDSDFSADEADAPVSEDDDDEEGTKSKRRKIMAKPFKKPVAPRPVEATKDKKPAQSGTEAKRNAERISRNSERKSMRQSTSQKSAESNQRFKEFEAKKRQKENAKKSIKNYQMTQEELLEEAKLTEIINQKSLEIYERTELEKKQRAKVVRQKVKVPMIRVHSLPMPFVEEVVKNKDTGRLTGAKVGQCERTFVTFPDEKSMMGYFPKKSPPTVRNHRTVNGGPARYFDPVTKLPFNSVQEFRLLRFAYCKYLDKKGNPNDPQIAAFQKWYRQQDATSIANMVKLARTS